MAATAPSSVAEVLLAFWSHAEEHYRAPDGTPSGELGNLKVALRPILQLYGMTLAKDFGPLALRAVRDRMVTEGLARTSVNARVNRIRRAFRWTASVELEPVAVIHTLGTVAELQKGRSWARESEPVGQVARGCRGDVASPAPADRRDGAASAADRDATGRGVHDAGV